MEGTLRKLYQVSLERRTWTWEMEEERPLLLYGLERQKWILLSCVDLQTLDKDFSLIIVVV